MALNPIGIRPRGGHAADSGDFRVQELAVDIGAFDTSIAYVGSVHGRVAEVCPRPSCPFFLLIFLYYKGSSNITRDFPSLPFS